MNNSVIYISIIVASEVLAVLWFRLLAKLNKNNHRNTISITSVLKGIAERAFIAFTLLSGIPQSLTLFAALKIATRIKEEDRISNDFYLLGNLLSITLAIVYSHIIAKYIGI